MKYIKEQERNATFKPIGRSETTLDFIGDFFLQYVHVLSAYLDAIQDHEDVWCVVAAIVAQVSVGCPEY